MKTLRATIAVAALAGVLVAGGPKASAEPMLTVDNTTVAVGGTVPFTATECLGEPGTTGPNIYQSIYAWIISGSGANARAGAFATAVGGSDDDYEVTVQGWVDPEEPATLVVWCVRGDFSSSDPTFDVVKAYGDTALDLTPAQGTVPSFTITASRTTASTGQIVVVEGAGCAPGAKATVGLRNGTDLTLRTNIIGDSVMVYAAKADAVGKIRVELELNRNYGEEGSDAYAPLPTGPYTIVAGCDGDPAATAAPPLPLNVPTANPVDTLAFTSSNGVVTATGQGCTDGRNATVAFSRASGSATLSVAATPANDGTWSAEFVESSGFISIRANCGDPLAEGFKYLAVAGSTEPSTSTTTTSTTSTDPGSGPPNAPAAAPVSGAATYAG